MQASASTPHATPHAHGSPQLARVAPRHHLLEMISAISVVCATLWSPQISPSRRVVSAERPSPTAPPFRLLRSSRLDLPSRDPIEAVSVVTNAIPHSHHGSMEHDMVLHAVSWLRVVTAARTLVSCQLSRVVCLMCLRLANVFSRTIYHAADCTHSHTAPALLASTDK